MNGSQRRGAPQPDDPTLADRVRFTQNALRRKIKENESDPEKTLEWRMAEAGAYSYAIGLLDAALRFSGITPI